LSVSNITQEMYRALCGMCSEAQCC